MSAQSKRSSIFVVFILSLKTYDQFLKKYYIMDENDALSE